MKRWCQDHPNAVTLALIVLLAATQALFVLDGRSPGYSSLEFWCQVVVGAIEIRWIRTWWGRT